MLTQKKNEIWESDRVGANLDKMDSLCFREHFIDSSSALPARHLTAVTACWSPTEVGGESGWPADGGVWRDDGNLRSKTALRLCLQTSLARANYSLSHTRTVFPVLGWDRWHTLAVIWRGSKPLKHQTKYALVAREAALRFTEQTGWSRLKTLFPLRERVHSLCDDYF